MSAILFSFYLVTADRPHDFLDARLQKFLFLQLFLFAYFFDPLNLEFLRAQLLALLAQLVTLVRGNFRHGNLGSEPIKEVHLLFTSVQGVNLGLGRSPPPLLLEVVLIVDVCPLTDVIPHLCLFSFLGVIGISLIVLFCIDFILVCTCRRNLIIWVSIELDLLSSDICLPQRDLVYNVFPLRFFHR